MPAKLDPYTIAALLSMRNQFFKIKPRYRFRIIQTMRWWTAFGERLALSSTYTLCIFTPTYNRASHLANLYESLKRQDSDFHWLIVDDGSSDNTEQLVNSIKENSPFPITYIKQRNGGKQRAFNTAVENCPNELLMCVDDDDLVPEGMIRAVLDSWDKFRNDETIAGMIGMCGKTATEPLGTTISPNIDRVTMWNLYYKYGHRGDTAHIHRTEILKQFPFDVEPDESFIGETYVFHQIDQHYDLGVMHRILIVREYFPDGYTANVRKVTRNNPKGYMKLKRMYIEYADSMLLKYYETILYLVGCHFAKHPKAIRTAPNPILAVLGWVPAKMLCYTVYRSR